VVPRLPEAWKSFATSLGTRLGNPRIYERPLLTALRIASEKFTAFGPLVYIEPGMVRGLFNDLGSIVAEAIAFSDMHYIEQRFPDRWEILAGPLVRATAPLNPKDSLFDGALVKRRFYQHARPGQSVGILQIGAMWEVKTNGTNEDIVDVGFHQYQRREEQYWQRGGKVRLLNSATNQPELFDVGFNSPLKVPRFLFISEPHFEHTVEPHGRQRRQPDGFLPGKVVTRKKFESLRLISLRASLNDILPLAETLTEQGLRAAAPQPASHQWERARMRNVLWKMISQSHAQAIDLLAPGDASGAGEFLHKLFAEDLVLRRMRIFQEGQRFHLVRGTWVKSLPPVHHHP